MPRELVRQELQSHLAAEHHILSHVDYAHSTAAQLLENPVMRNRPARQFTESWLRLGQDRGFLSRYVSSRDWARSLCRHLYRYQEPVSSAGQSLHEPLILSRIVQRLAQSPDGCVDAVIEFHNRVVWPESLPDLFAGYHLSRQRKKHRQNLKRLFGKPDPKAISAQFP